MSDEHNPIFDGIYVGYFSGLAGVSFGIFVFKDGIISGADAGEATYDGKFKVSDDEQHVVGEVKFNIGIGGQSITGVVAETEPLHFDIPFELPIEVNPDEVIRIETPNGPINAKFSKLRGL